MSFLVLHHQCGQSCTLHPYQYTVWYVTSMTVPPHKQVSHCRVWEKKKIYICAQNTQSQDKQGQQPPSCFPARLMCDFAN